MLPFSYLVLPDFPSCRNNLSDFVGNCKTTPSFRNWRSWLPWWAADCKIHWRSSNRWDRCWMVVLKWKMFECCWRNKNCWSCNVCCAAAPETSCFSGCNSSCYQVCSMEASDCFRTGWPGDGKMDAIVAGNYVCPSGKCCGGATGRT